MEHNEKKKLLRQLRDEIESNVCNSIIDEIMTDVDDFDSLKTLEKLQIRIVLRKQLKLTTKYSV